MPSKGTTSQRGYGAVHQKLRKHWTPIVQAGKAHCGRCGQPLPPDARWDLGHRDGGGPHDYTGPEHVGKECPLGGNRATKGRQNKPTTDTSRQW